jgi:hypothetical protein
MWVAMMVCSCAFGVQSAYRFCSGDRQIVAWDVEVGNVGNVAYNALPGAQTFVSHLMTNGQVREGQWYASAEAMRSAGLNVDERALDIVRLETGESVFTHVGSVYATR